MKKALFASLLFSVFAGSIVAIDDSFRVGKNTEIQEAEELSTTEKSLDSQIVDINNRLTRYAKLQALTVEYTPFQTIFRKDGDKNYVEIEAYSFLTEGMVKTNGDRSGYRKRVVRLFYENNALSKVESSVIEENFITKERYESTVLDPSPTDENTNDITLTTKFNKAETYSIGLAKMENTISNPLRIEFKRDFYINFLTDFEKLFRYTEEYQKQYGTQEDYITIQNLKRGLVY